MVIEAQRVSYRQGGLPLVRNVTLAVGPGEMLAIVGRRGSGAATLWRLLAGEIAPSAGRVLVRGRSSGRGLGRDPRITAHGPDATRDLLTGARDDGAADVLLCEQPAVSADGPALLARCRERADAGAAVVVTVADLALATAHAHTVAVVEAGRLVAWAAPSFAAHLLGTLPSPDRIP
ncbi:MAG: ATP-binding cassette domain-containing protein [Acidimicrobiia bacterium]